MQPVICAYAGARPEHFFAPVYLSTYQYFIHLQYERTKKVDIKTNNDKNKPLHFLCMYDWALFYFCVVEFTAILLHTG